MSAPDADSIWLTRRIYEDAEINYYENLAKAVLTPLAGEVAKARQRLIESRDTFTKRLQIAYNEIVEAFYSKSPENNAITDEESVDKDEGDLNRLRKSASSPDPDKHLRNEMCDCQFVTDWL